MGNGLNPWVFSLLRYWLKAVFVPVNRPFNVVDNILNFSAVKLSSYFKTGITLKLLDTDNKLIKREETGRDRYILYIYRIYDGKETRQAEIGTEFYPK